MGMFCFQCQETAKNTGCTVVGVCGKNEEVAKLQDLLIYITKGISEIVIKGNMDVKSNMDVSRRVINSLFITITNANFDPDAIEKDIKEMLDIRDKLRAKTSNIELSDASTFTVTDRQSMIEKASKIGVLATGNEDIRSLREMIMYGLKGMAAYLAHGINLKSEDPEIYKFILEALAKTLDNSLTDTDLFNLTLETGENGVKAMALLDAANTGAYGKPEITKVNIGVGKNPAILVTGHDLHDINQLLQQTEGTGIDVYTHSEMLPTHYYPELKKYKHLVGNYGNAWWEQLKEFKPFNGPILFTTNCIVPPRDEEIKARIFTTSSTGFPGCKHIDEKEDGTKDFSPIIEMAKKCAPPEEIETGEIIGGFAHDQVLALSDKIVAAVKSGAIKKFVVMAGCDGRMKSREYYTEFAKKLPKDTIILTAGCAKYRYNKLDLGDIGGIPRILDAGQCNDSYSLAVIALKLKEIFELEDVNDLPLVFNIAWYEQKAIIVLLALLYLGFKNIHVGPTLPGFLSPNITKVLSEKFGLATIGTVDEDMKLLLS